MGVAGLVEANDLALADRLEPTPLPGLAYSISKYVCERWHELHG